MISVYDEFTQLKEVILGDVNIGLTKHLKSHEKTLVEEILLETKENLNDIQKIYESCGITVHRPNIQEEFSETIQSPFFSTKGIRNPLSPRDAFIVIGNTILETAGYREDMMFEYLYYKKIFMEQWKHNTCDWNKMPSPSYHNDIEDNIEPMLDAAQIMRLGENLLVSEQGAANAFGIEWLQRHMPKFNVIKAGKVITGHIDAQIKIVRPGLIITPHVVDNLPKCFENWDIIQPTDTSGNLLNFDGILFRDDDVENTFPSCAMMSLNEDTIFCYEHWKHSHKDFINTLENNKLNVIFVPFKHQHWFNQGLTCLTMELHRDGGMEKYI